MGKNANASFIFGVFVGVIVGFSLAKKYYGKVCNADKETETYMSEVSDDTEKKNETVSKIISQNNYDSEKNTYIISPEEFGSIDGYYTVSLYYFEDGVITDDAFEQIDDDVIENISVSEHFGEFEDDTVFVRNDVLKSDYEILRDGRYFSEVRN